MTVARSSFIFRLPVIADHLEEMLEGAERNAMGGLTVAVHPLGRLHGVHVGVSRLVWRPRERRWRSLFSCLLRPRSASSLHLPVRSIRYLRLAASKRSAMGGNFLRVAYCDDRASFCCNRSWAGSRSSCVATPPPGTRTRSILRGAGAADRRTRTRISPSSHPWRRRSGLDATIRTPPTSACRGRRFRELRSVGRHPSRCEVRIGVPYEPMGMAHCFLVQRVRRHHVLLSVGHTASVE